MLNQPFLSLLVAFFVLLASPALAWKTVETADIKVDQRLDIDGEALWEKLGDFENWESLFHGDCVNEWIHGTETSGPAARSRVSYQIKSWKRRLTVVFIKNEAVVQETVVKDSTGKVIEVRTKTVGWIIDADHEGNKGFVTRWRIDAPKEGSDGKTRVRLETLMNAPPWPFRKYYFNKVKPGWTTCYETTMTRLSGLVSGA